MGVGDVHATLTSLAGLGTFTITAEAGDEWVVHNVYYSDAIDVVVKNGSVRCTIETSGGGGALTSYFIHVTEVHNIELVNRTGSAIVVGYDAIETR